MMSKTFPVMSPQNFLFRLLLVFCLVGFFPASTFAQEADGPFGNRPNNPEDSPVSADTYRPPSVFAIDAQYEVVNGVVQGTFTALNNDEEVVGDIQYRIDLLSPLPELEENVLIQDSASVFDQTVIEDTFAVIPGEEKNISFSYTPPTLPEGDYRLRIQLISSRGREMGWFDGDIRLGVPNIPFLELVPGTIYLPDFPDEVIPPNSGPNVSPGSEVRIRALVTNPQDTPVTAIPVLDTYEFDVARGVEFSTPLGEAITLAAGEEREVEFTIQVSDEPQVYYNALTFRDEESDAQLSSIAGYRWVVRGLDADIISARIATLRTKQGEQVEVDVEYVGPADAETEDTGSLLVELTDEEGVVASLRVDDTPLSDMAQTGRGRLTLDRDLVGIPGLVVTLFDAQGAELDRYEIPIPITEDQVAALASVANEPVAEDSTRNINLMLAVGLAIAAIILLVVLVAWLKGKNNNVPPAAGVTISILLLISSLGAAGGAYAIGSGNGVTVRFPSTVQQLCPPGSDWCYLGGYITETFVNSPVHNRTYSNRSNVPLSYRVSWIACTNGWTYLRSVVRYSPQGKKHTSWQPASGTSWDNIIDFYWARHGAGLCSTYACRTSNNYSTRLNLRRLPETIGETTLQVMSIRNWGAPPPSWSENYGFWSSWPYNHNLHATNVWLNFPTPTPTPNPKPPIARINAQSACLDGTITADGSSSSDPDGTITSYNWSVSDPNGAPVSVNASASSVSFPASVEGSYSVSLTVTDNEGLTSTRTTSVAAFNNPPIASINVTQTVAREPITLDGTNSYDPDTQQCGDVIETYEWEVVDSSNAPVTVENSDQDVATFTPQTSGDYEVTLNVTDNKGKTGTKTITVGVDRPEFDPEGFQEID